MSQFGISEWAGCCQFPVELIDDPLSLAQLGVFDRQLLLQIVQSSAQGSDNLIFGLLERKVRGC